MADTSKITLGQLKTALTQAKAYTDNEIAGVTGVTKVEPEELDMPKVFFYGDALPTSKADVLLTMDYISNTAKFSSYIKLKCQGTSSMGYDKKNFTINMFSDEARATKLKKDFKGWGAQSKFCLKANYVDTTHTRNISGARIAYDMVASRPDSPFKQQLLQCPRNGAVDGFPIKVYFNGEFYGIYTWNIPKDAWMFNMDKSNPNHVVLCAEKNTNGNANLINSCQFRQLWTNGDGNDWSVEVGTYSTDMVASFNRCINFVMTATDQEFHDNIGEYFDLYSLLDYYCFSYFTCHIDGLAKNMLMVTYDGVIWGAGLYDMDSIYGANWRGSEFYDPTYQCPEQYQEQFSRLWARIEQCFATELYARYRELRKGALSLSNIVKHVEEIYDVIPDRVFADEKVKWTNLPGVNANTMTRFRNFMRDRAAYVDAEMLTIGNRVACTGITLSANDLSITTVDAQTLVATVEPSNTTDAVTWSVSPAGIVSVDGGVVTPIASGTCTVTATCGSQTAQCTINVDMPITYSITKELTNVTIDNATTRVEPNDSYIANITADENYELDSVIVTMGGEDITSTVYAGGTINIAAVTGDVVITAVASNPGLAPKVYIEDIDGVAYLTIPNLKSAPAGSDYLTFKPSSYTNDTYTLYNLAFNTFSTIIDKTADNPVRGLNKAIPKSTGTTNLTIFSDPQEGDLWGYVDPNVMFRLHNNTGHDTPKTYFQETYGGVKLRMIASYKTNQINPASITNFVAKLNDDTKQWCQFACDSLPSSNVYSGANSFSGLQGGNANLGSAVPPLACMSTTVVSVAFPPGTFSEFTVDNVKAYFTKNPLIFWYA